MDPTKGLWHGNYCVNSILPLAWASNPLWLFSFYLLPLVGMRQSSVSKLIREKWTKIPGFHSSSFTIYYTLIFIIRGIWFTMQLNSRCFQSFTDLCRCPLSLTGSSEKGMFSENWLITGETDHMIYRAYRSYGKEKEKSIGSPKVTNELIGTKIPKISSLNPCSPAWISGSGCNHSVPGSYSLHFQWFVLFSKAHNFLRFIQFCLSQLLVGPLSLAWPLCAPWPPSKL